MSNQNSFSLTLSQLTEAVIAMDFHAAKLREDSQSAEREIDRAFAVRDLGRLERARSELRAMLPVVEGV